MSRQRHSGYIDQLTQYLDRLNYHGTSNPGLMKVADELAKKTRLDLHLCGCLHVRSSFTTLDCFQDLTEMKRHSRSLLPFVFLHPGQLREEDG